MTRSLFCNLPREHPFFHPVTARIHNRVLEQLENYVNSCSHVHLLSKQKVAGSIPAGDTNHLMGCIG